MITHETMWLAVDPIHKIVKSFNDGGDMVKRTKHE